MANYLERVAAAGARTAQLARPPLGAPAMLPEVVSAVSQPALAAPRLDEPAAVKAEAARGVPGVPPPAAVIVERLVPPGERVTVTQIARETLEVTPVASAPVESVARETAIEPGAAASVEVGHAAAENSSAPLVPAEPPQDRIAAKVIQATPAPPPPDPVIKVQGPPPPKPAVGARPAAPFVFRFQQPPVRLEAPKAMRPTPTVSGEPRSAPPPDSIAPPEPVSLPIARPSIVAAGEVQPIRSAPPPAPQPLAAKQKRIHIGAVEVHVHQDAPPAPKPPAAPRPAPPNHADPFEQRSLGRFVLRP